MPALPPSGTGDRTGELQRCIRDLAALSALPSLCVGKAPDEALEIVLEALPTALDCDLVYLHLPGAPPRERGTFRGAAMAADQLAEVARATATDADGCDAELFLAEGKVFCLEAEIPIGEARGRLLAGRRSPLHPETDRLLVRTAANVVGTVLASADVLDVARRKDDFLAMLGHELRNPLAPIATAVELLRRNPTAVRERNVIDRHVQHLSRIVDDLLDISRVTRGHVELRREYVPLASILERAVEIATPLIARNGHRLEVASAADVTLRGDLVRLAQIFGNLLTNAAKFTPPGGKIEVLVERPPGRVRVTVRDNGSGIARDQLARIFEPFVQADRERDALRGGLGLGLAIVNNLVQRHGGTVSVESEGRGRGAAFTVDLPTAVGAERPRETAPPQPAGARAGVRILVVDDNVDLAELLSEALQEEGFQTSVAHDGRGALATWRSFLPHAGVLDVGLPDVDGYELARALRAEHGPGATLIAATGYGQPTDRSRAADAGFDCHLVKPVNVHDLVVVLDQRVVGAERGDRRNSPDA
ncbi:MAG TPA: hybrid sensor histidine kinase/response regulator [Polyangia bacterium]|nr:hybrid sensor histidine kinase/response regulator [Polyangia bacterium]